MFLLKWKSLSWHRIIFSFIFSVINLFVFYLQHEDIHYLVFVANLPVLTVIVYFITGKLLVYCSKENHIYSDVAEDLSVKQYFWKVSLVLFVAWLPIFLVYYPGIFSYDVQAQLPQIHNAYNTHHPLIHTLYLQFFYYIIGEKLFSSYTIGIAFATILQMSIFAMMLSFGHMYLYKCGLRKRIRYILIIVTALLPQFSMLSISMTKDTFFSGCCCIYLTSLAIQRRFPNSKRKKFFTVIHILSGIGIILLRNNGIFPMIGMFLFSGYECWCTKQKNFFINTVICIVVGVIIQNSIVSVLSAEKGSKNEMLNVPQEQVAGVYYENASTLTTEEKEYIEWLFPSIENYKPTLSDYIKYTCRIEEDFSGFFSFYLKTGLKYPYTYIKAFVLLNAGYLGLSDITYSEIYTKYNRAGVLLSDTRDGFGINHQSFIPPLENIYESLYTENYYLYIIGLNILLSPALYFWIIVFLLMSAIMSKKKQTVVFFIFVGILFLSMLFGPCVLVRYALPYILTIPLLFVSVFDKSEKNFEH